MNAEWPLGRAPAAAHAEPLLPLAFREHVELIKASAAIDAFCSKRAVQIITHGHTPEADLQQTPVQIAREAKARIHAFLEIMPYGRMNLPPHERERLLRYIEVSAALLIALWDRCQVEVPEA